MVALSQSRSHKFEECSNRVEHNGDESWATFEAPCILRVFPKVDLSIRTQESWLLTVDGLRNNRLSGATDSIEIELVNSTGTFEGLQLAYH